MWCTKTRLNFVILNIVEIQYYADYQKSAKRVQPSTQTHGTPQFGDRMALYITGYTGIKQGLSLQAPHRIPNTMEPRTSGLAVTSFLEKRVYLYDAFPSKLTDTERRWCPVQQVTSANVYLVPCAFRCV